MPDHDWQNRIERHVKLLLLVATAGVIVTIATAANSWRTKSLLEQRVEMLEEAERTNREFKKGVAAFMEEMINASTPNGSHKQ